MIDLTIRSLYEVLGSVVVSLRARDVWFFDYHMTASTKSYSVTYDEPQLREVSETLNMMSYYVTRLTVLKTNLA